MLFVIGYLVIGYLVEGGRHQSMIIEYCLKGKYKTTPGNARRYGIGFHCALKGPNNC
jgi:hypothetical protein